MALIAAAVTATATTGLWLLPRKSTTDQRPLPPNTSVRGLWVKNLDAGNEWVPDLVAAQNQRIWLSGLVQSSALGDSANAVLHLWESSAPIDSGTSIVHISFSNGKAAATSQYQVLVRHGPQWFFALDVSSAVLTDNTGSQLAWLGNKSVTVSSPARKGFPPYWFELGPLASSERLYFEIWGELIPENSVQYGFTPHGIWWQSPDGEIWLTADNGTVGQGGPNNVP